MREDTKEFGFEDEAAVSSPEIHVHGEGQRHEKAWGVKVKVRKGGFTYWPEGSGM